MLKIENVVTPSEDQWEAIIRGMRNPKNSWDRMDSHECEYWECDRCHLSDETGCTIGCEPVSFGDFIIGPNDKQLMTSLANGGPVHAKYRRKINVYLDITAPLYWWKEFDTYKIGTSTDSCSTMHKIHAKEFTLEDFSCEHLIGGDIGHQESCESCGTYYTINDKSLMDMTVKALNSARSMYLLTKDKKYWWQMIQLLPTSYNQRRSVMLNYEVLVNIYKWRKNHKLDEWHTFCDWIESLPYSELITGCNKEKEDG